jgi:diguanylate cyclase (GGDEF)-like protein/PAS domain S-box-containing protein
MRMANQNYHSSAFGDDLGNLQAIVEAAPVAMVVVDGAGKIVLVNAETQRLFDYSRASLLASSIEVLMPERFRAGHPALRDGYVDRPKRRPMGLGRDLCGLRSDGTEVPIEIGLTPIVTMSGTFTLASIIDITERKRAEELLRQAVKEAIETRQLALIDELTGIANRRAFDDSFAREWARAVRHGGELCLVMADIDHFKEFNDTYGHRAGDEVLHAVAHAILSALHRPADSVARYGGEEIAAILPETTLAGGAAIAESMRQAVERTPIVYRGKSLGSVTISLGVARCRPREGSSAEDLIVAADTALYHAKSKGRNCVVSSP